MTGPRSKTELTEENKKKLEELDKEYADVLSFRPLLKSYTEEEKVRLLEWLEKTNEIHGRKNVICERGSAIMPVITGEMV
jgi:hypothetical protein